MRSFLFDKIAILASAFFFCANSMVVSYAAQESHLTPGFFAVGRSIVGIIFVLFLYVYYGSITWPKEKGALIIRACSYFIATVSFFQTIKLLGPTLGNMLNLTYPLFLACFALKTGDDRSTIVGTVFSAVVAFLGITLILGFNSSSNLEGIVIGLVSGFAAAISISSLRKARGADSTESVLLVLFGISLPLSLITFGNELYLPNEMEVAYLFFASLFGVLGQFFISLGTKHLSATESGVISQSRVLISVVLGTMLGIEPFPSAFGSLGVLLLLGSNLYLIMRPKRGAQQTAFGSC